MRTAPAPRRGADLHAGDARPRAPRCPRSPRRRARSARRRSETAARSAATSAPPRRRATRCRRSSSRTPRSSSRASRGTRRLPLREFLVGPKRNALADDELIAAVHVEPSGAPQTFMKVGPRNAMVIAVCSLALVVDRERDEIRASFGSAGPVAGLVVAPLADIDDFPEHVAEAASPIDDVRGKCRVPAPRAARARRGARSRGASPREDRRHRERRARRGGRLGRREPPLRAPRALRVAGLEERVRAGRMRLLLGACSTASSCAPASSSRRRPMATRS